MSVVKTIAQTTKTLGRYHKELAAAHARQSVLCTFAQPSDVIAALRSASSLTSKERAAIILALVVEQQQKPHPLWQGLLIAAFEPMLTRIRVYVSRKRNEDLDQQVLLAFLIAVAKVPCATVGSHAPLALRWATERAVLTAVRAGDEAFDDEPFDAGIEGWSPFSDAREPPEADSFIGEVRRILAASGFAHETIDMVVATCAGDESIADFVDRVHASKSPRERASIAKNAKVERTAALDHVRDRFLGARRAA